MSLLKGILKISESSYIDYYKNSPVSKLKIGTISSLFSKA